MYYDVPHGFAVALSLAGVAEINRGHFPNDSELFGLFDMWGGIREWLVETSRNIIKLDIINFNFEDLSIIVEEACANGRMSNNPCEISSDDVQKILSDSYNNLNANDIRRR